MKQVLCGLVASVGFAERAHACVTSDDVAARFAEVQAAYVKQVSSLTAKDYASWDASLKVYARQLANNDFAGACATLDKTSEAMNLKT